MLAKRSQHAAHIIILWGIHLTGVRDVAAATDQTLVPRARFSRVFEVADAHKWVRYQDLIGTGEPRQHPAGARAPAESVACRSPPARGEQPHGELRLHGYPRSSLWSRRAQLRDRHDQRCGAGTACSARQPIPSVACSLHLSAASMSLARAGETNGWPNKGRTIRVCGRSIGLGCARHVPRVETTPLRRRRDGYPTRTRGLCWRVAVTAAAAAICPRSGSRCCVQSVIGSRRRSNKSLLAYAFSVWLRTTCASAASTTARG